MVNRVGSSALAEWFYVGRYADIIAETFDSHRDVAPHDVAWVVGALTFVDRVDDARAVLDAAGATDRRTSIASRFFLGLASARAGYFDRALQLLVRDGFRARHDPDPWVRAFVFQGIAAHCYFTGHYAGAARNAQRALNAAHAAKFLYLSLLGTDMRGHSLVQMGQLQRGIATLEQAKKLALRLGLVNNAFAVDTSIATYVSRFVPRDESLGQIEALLRKRSHDSYSRRALLTEAAVQLALRGRRAEAIAAIEDADRDALRGDTRRGKVASMLARLWVTRWQHGALACRQLVDWATELVEPRDVAFGAELLGFEVLVARALGDPRREQRALEQLRALWKASHHFYAKAALGQYDPTWRTSAFDEDALTPVLRAVAQRDHGALSRIVSLGLNGVIPELLGLTPGRRIILIPAEDLLLLEDHGNIVVRHRPPRWCPMLLRILASGDASKERIVAGLWGLRAYHPERHDPPVRTTVHRLRAFLQPHGDWIEVSDGGYRTTVPVHLVASGEPLVEPAPLWEEGEVPTIEPRHEPAPRTLEGNDLVYDRLEELAEASVPQLARALELSQSTVLRALRELVAARRVERVGFARATKYRPIATRY